MNQLLCAWLTFIFKGQFVSKKLFEEIWSQYFRAALKLEPKPEKTSL